MKKIENTKVGPTSPGTVYVFRMIQKSGNVLRIFRCSNRIIIWLRLFAICFLETPPFVEVFSVAARYSVTACDDTAIPLPSSVMQMR